MNIKEKQILQGRNKYILWENKYLQRLNNPLQKEQICIKKNKYLNMKDKYLQREIYKKIRETKELKGMRKNLFPEMVKNKKIRREGKRDIKMRWDEIK